MALPAIIAAVTGAAGAAATGFTAICGGLMSLIVIIVPLVVTFIVATGKAGTSSLKGTSAGRWVLLFLFLGVLIALASWLSQYGLQWFDPTTWGGAIGNMLGAVKLDLTKAIIGGGSKLVSGAASAASSAAWWWWTRTTPVGHAANLHVRVFDWLFK